MAGSGDKWRWADPEGVQRVVQLDELRTALANGVLPPHTLVWRAGMPKWQRANEVPELMATPAPSLRSTIVGVPPPPASMVAVQSAFERGGFPASSAEAAKPKGAPPTAAAGESRKNAPAAVGPATDAVKKQPAATGPAAAPSEPKKKSVPSAGVSPAGEAKKSIPPNAWGGAATVKKKSVPPPAPPAPAVKPVTAVGVSAKSPASPVAAARPGAEAGKNVAPQGSDDNDFDTWLAKPAPTAQELAAAAQGAPPTVPQGAGAVQGFPPATQGAAALAYGAQAPAARPSTIPHTALPPTPMTSPLPPPPRRSHPAPGGHPSVQPSPSSTIPQPFSQSSASHLSPYAVGNALAPPSVPHLHPPPTQGQADPASSINGVDGDLPAFPLDEIDPDDSRPFRPSQGAGPATSPSGHPGLALDTGRPRASAGPTDRSEGGGLFRGALDYIKANPKDPKLLAGLSGGAVLVVGLLWGFVAMSGAKSKGSSTDDSSKPDSPAADPAGSAKAASAGVVATKGGAPAPTKIAGTACRLTGAPSRLAEKASKDVPLELAVAATGERARLGFATAASAAQGISIDLASLQVTPEFAKPPKEKLRAVIPFGEDSAEFVVQSDGHGDKVKAWRTISVDPPTVVGWWGASLAVASKPNQAPTTLWSLDGNEPLDAVRAAHAGERGHAIVFRRHGSIYGGMVGADRAPVGDLVKITGAGAPPGSPVGTPTVAVNNQSVAVAFADRASSDEPWSIRIGSAPLGSFPQATTPFVVPPGGRGGATLAPALSGLPDGGWLLVWTEGSGGAHDVRGVTLGADLAPVGAALTVSRAGSNAGQGAVALRAGRGLVAYLALTEEGYEVWGTSVDCR